MSFISLKKLVDDSVKRSGIKDDVDASRALGAAQEIFQELLGTDTAKTMKPLYVKRGVLTVSCMSSVAAQELKLREREIVKRVNEKVGKPIVERLRFFA